MRGAREPQARERWCGHIRGCLLLSSLSQMSVYHFMIILKIWETINCPIMGDYHNKNVGFLFLHGPLLKKQISCMNKTKCLNRTVKLCLTKFGFDSS